MRFPVLPALLFLLLCVAVDRVIYKEIVGRRGKGILSGAYTLSSILLAIFFVVIVCVPKRTGSNSSLLFVMWGLLAYLSLYLPKLIYLLFRAISSIPLIVKLGLSRYVRAGGVMVGICACALLWWGALVNRENIEVNRVEIGIAGLPKSLDGLRIAQISDFHLGTYGNDTSYVHKVVERINQLNPDVIFFTGDLVNRRSSEALPFVAPLSRLKARYGVYSILGNHDYGDYYEWADEKTREEDVAHLCALMSEMGWHTLHNSTGYITAGDDSIAVIGVGNVSRPPFRVYGDLSKAYPTLGDKNIKILLTHNPDHWTDSIENNPDVNVHLALSGHTHAMQFEIGGMSPASFKYENWGGLSTDSLGQKLYVNIGLGTEGVPFRIGATPEITLFTLKSDK